MIVTYAVKPKGKSAGGRDVWVIEESLEGLPPIIMTQEFDSETAATIEANVLTRKAMTTMEGHD